MKEKAKTFYGMTANKNNDFRSEGERQVEDPNINNLDSVIHEETLKVARQCEARAQAITDKFGPESEGAKLWRAYANKLRALAENMPI